MQISVPNQSRVFLNVVEQCSESDGLRSSSCLVVSSTIDWEVLRICCTRYLLMFGELLWWKELEVATVSQYLGRHCSVHVAEYTALVMGMETALRRGVRHLTIMCDSLLVFNQASDPPISWHFYLKNIVNKKDRSTWTSLFVSLHHLFQSAFEGLRLNTYDLLLCQTLICCRHATLALRHHYASSCFRCPLL